jgi:type I restriction enzyme S subunit
LNSLAELLLDSRKSGKDTYADTDTWRTTRLKHLFEFERGGVWGDEPSGTNDDVVCVRVADFKRSIFKAGTDAATRRSVARSQLATRLLRSGDVLLEKSGGGEQSPVGFAVSYDGETRAVCSNFVSFLRVKPEHDPRFAALLMGAMYHTGRNVPYIKQTTGIQNLDGPAYLGQRTRVPPLPRQREIAAEVDTENEHVEALIIAQRRHVTLLDERLRALITATVSGQVDVTTARGVAVP